MTNDLLTFMTIRAAARKGDPVKQAFLPETLLDQLGEWAKTDGWWNREWATASEAADALAVELSELQSLVDTKALVGYQFEGALHIPSRDLAVAVWEKATAQA